jgi:hypothetical protein
MHFADGDVEACVGIKASNDRGVTAHEPRARSRDRALLDLRDAPLSIEQDEEAAEAPECVTERDEEMRKKKLREIGVRAALAVESIDESDEGFSKGRHASLIVSAPFHRSQDLQSWPRLPPIPPTDRRFMAIASIPQTVCSSARSTCQRGR